VIALVLSLIYAGLSWRFLERPLLERRKPEIPAGAESEPIQLTAPTL